MLKVSAKLMDRPVLLIGLGSVSDQPHCADESPKGVIEPPCSELRHERQRSVVLCGVLPKGQFSAAGTSRTRASFVKAISSRGLFVRRKESGIGQSDQFIGGVAQ